MGRLLAAGLIVFAAMVAILVANGTGPGKPEDKASQAPGQESSQVAHTAPGGSGAKQGAGAETAAAVVTMKHLRFRPDTVVVAPGDTVKFVNHDDVTHTVFEDFGARSGEIPQVDSKKIPPGGTFSFVARGVGPIAYVCTLHPTVMQGQILVEKPAT